MKAGCKRKPADKIDLRRICKPGTFSNINSYSEVVSEKRVTSTEIFKSTEPSSSTPRKSFSYYREKEQSCSHPNSSKRSPASTDRESSTGTGFRSTRTNLKTKHDRLAEKLAACQSAEKELRVQVAKNKSILGLAERVVLHKGEEIEEMKSKIIDRLNQTNNVLESLMK